MRNLISLVLLFVGFNAFAIPSGSQNALSLGGISSGISNLDNIVIPEANSQGYFNLYASSASVTANNFGILFKNGAPYQVTAGKTFKVVKVCLGSNANVGATGTAGFIQLVTATASFSNNANAITGGVFQSGFTSTYAMMAQTATIYAYTCYDITFDMGATTFAGFQPSTTNSNSIIVLGKEI